ncbi:MAG: hypothetical protein NVV59_08910 [Chitinophagaceae bacterium]|nr:hypothetical protein [Chitinophagaceae bacterium]
MKLFIFLLVVTLHTSPSYSQVQVKLGHLKGHVGDSVIVCGEIKGGVYLPNANNAPTLINVGYDYPNQLLTIVIFGGDRTLFEGNPETDWIQRKICVSGRVELYRDKPQIVIRNTNQISFEE